MAADKERILMDAIEAANWWLNSSTEEQIRNFAFDRLVDELRMDGVFRTSLLLEMEKKVDGHN